MVRGLGMLEIRYKICTGYTPSVVIVGGIPSCERFGGMQLVCSSYLPKLKLPSPRASLVFSWRQVAAFPRLGSGIAGARMASAPRDILIAASSTKASKTPTSMAHNVGRAQENGAGQGIRLKLMARSLAPRCVTTYGHLDALALYLSPGLAQQCVGTQHIGVSTRTAAR